MTGSPRYSGATGWLDFIVDAFAVIAGVITCILVVLVCWDVAARFVRALEASWIFYTIEYLIYLMAFLGAPWVLRDRGHIVVDLMTQAFSDDMRRKLDIVTSAIGALVCALVGYYLALEWLEAFNEGRKVSEHTVFPGWFRAWMVMAPGPIVFFLMALLFVRMIFVPPSVRPGLRTGDGDGV